MRSLDRYSVRKHLLLWVIVALLIILRFPDAWRSGEFFAEDACVFFADAYNKPWHVSLFTPYAGYFHLLPRIVAELYSLLPIVWQPYAYTGFSITLSAFFLTVFYYPHFKGVISDDRIRAFVVILLTLCANAEDLGFLLGVHWYLSFVMTLMLVIEPPENRAGKIAMYTLGFFSVWSAPATMVLFPFLLYKGIRGTSSFVRRWALFCCLNMILVVCFIIWMRLAFADRTGAFVLAELIVGLERLVLRGWLGCGLLGESPVRLILNHFAIIIDFWSVLWLCFFSWILWRYRNCDRIRRIAVLLAVSLLMIFLGLTRTEFISELSKTMLSRHPRYLTAPTLLLIISLWGIASEFWSKEGRRLLYCCGFLQILLLLVSAPVSWHLSHPDFPKAPGVYKLRDYVDAIHAFEENYRKTGKPSTLYIPMDVAFWGPVLIRGGGVKYLPPNPLAGGLGCDADEDGYCDSWLGKFRQFSNSPMVEHELFGQLEFLGIIQGRVWFLDSQDRTVFTSPLLYPVFFETTRFDITSDDGKN